jgi:hypothetical protein
MVKFAEADVAYQDALVSQVEQIKDCSTLEDVAQRYCDILYERFRESIVLARVFVTVPFGELPAENQGFVTTLATSAGISDLIGDQTPVMSLVGTRGILPNWNDRRKSQGHVGIPLASGEFIGSIPMMSRLLKQLGVDLDWIDQWDSSIVSEKFLTGLSGMFYVRDAGSELDRQGRKIIAAQDFVAAHDVKTVFGFGGAYLTGKAIITIIVFTRDTVEKAQIEGLQKSVNAFKIASMDQAISGHVFQ